MRKSFDGLCQLVEQELKRNPMSGEVYIFMGRQRNTLKLLHWEGGGFVLYYKRLEQGTFEIPNFDQSTCSYQIKWTDLVFMLEGISLGSIKHRKRFSSRSYVDNFVNK